MTHLYGPAVRCKRFFVDLVDAVLHYCIRPLIGAVCSGPSWISARIRPDSRKSLERASWVTSVRTRREDRSVHRRLILSQTSAGNSREASSSNNSVFHAVPLFVPGGRSFVPARACTGAPRARPVKAGRRDEVAACASVSRPRLDGPEHGAKIKQIGTLLHWSWRTRRRARYGEPPRRCGRVCWRAQSPARCGEAFSWLLRSTG
jgi:hypothetical protein